ncbi:lipid-binding protein [Pedobacter psychrodurus]|uniref:lipid-binding protein n=1 Tax=Pedobacter psychrodurus TaxID=2530456 RepID=UPI00292DF402|nr:lipid-binding protein [Pedobacter psychrodurus]
MKKYFYILTLFVLSISACKKDEPVGGTAVQDLSGEWWVQIDGEGDYYGISTYNTADNSSSQMWLNLTNLWSPSTTETIFGKVNINLDSKTFSGQNIANAGTYPGGLTFTVTNGKVTPNGAVGPSSKATTDAIALDIVFSDDTTPGTVYHLKGYHRTKFVGDDH